MEVYRNSDFLERLTEAPSPSGYEKPALDVFVSEVKSYYDEEPEVDKFGNTYFKIGSGDTKVLLSGHIDEVSAVVTNIDKEGNISIGQASGIDKKDLVASSVILLTDDFDVIPGIVTKLPVHLEHAEKKLDKVTEFEELRVDIGCENKEDVLRAGVHPGTPVLYKREHDFHFGLNKLHSVGLDDKIGVFVAEEIFRNLANPQHFPQDWKKKYTVYCLAATQEEVGCRSVCVAARRINPDISIDFDVTFATDGGFGINNSKHGEVRLGAGAVLSYGPDKSLRINTILKKGSNRLQEVATNRAGGTNTSNIQLFSDDCETTLVSIPNRSMHTRVEVCDWRDVQSAVDAVTYAITVNLL